MDLPMNRAPISLWIACLLIACVGFAAASQAAEQYREDAVKAAFLYRFTGYVEWPQESADSGQFTIAVIGGDSVARELDKLLPGHTIKGRPAKVVQIKSPKEIGAAQMLYVGPEFNGDVGTLIGTIPSYVLIVTDDADGLDEGSIVNFMLVDRRVRFEISVSAAERAGLKVSSELLSVAARVRGVPQRSEATCEPRLFNDALRSACVPELASL
jgi:hypothetical protein